MTGDNAALITRTDAPARHIVRKRSSISGELPVARARVDGKFLTRGGQRLHVQGVTYGPFAPDSNGDQFPSRRRVCDDFRAMADGGINAIRTYHVPPECVLDLADEHGINVFVDIPWRKHLCFLDSDAAQVEARASVAAAARRGASHPCLLAL